MRHLKAGADPSSASRLRGMRPETRRARRTVRPITKFPRAEGVNVSSTMQPQFVRTSVRAKRLRGVTLRAMLYGIGLGASALAGATSTSGVTPQTLDEAWWTGPLLAPNAATLPQGHWLLEPYVYDLMPYGHFDHNGTLTSTGAGNDVGSQSYIEYGLIDRVTLGLIPRLGLHESSAG